MKFATCWARCWETLLTYILNIVRARHSEVSIRHFKLEPLHAFSIYHSGLTLQPMLERPQPNEAASYYSTYIDRVPSDNIVDVLATQLEETVDFLCEISEDQSLH